MDFRNQFSSLCFFGGIVLLTACVEPTPETQRAGIIVENPGGSGLTGLSITSPGLRIIEANGRPSLVADFGTPTVSGGTPPYTITNNAPVSSSDPNMYEFAVSPSPVDVFWTVQDSSAPSLVEIVSQQVIVRDTTPPMITLTGSNPLAVSLPMNTPLTTLTTLNIGSASAVDTVDGARPVTFVFEKDGVPYVPAAGGAANEYQFPIGLTRVIYTSVDASGNMTTVIQQVSITTGLAIIPPAPKTFEATGPLTPLGDTALGRGEVLIQGGVAPYVISNNSPAAGFPLGANTVIWTVTDSANDTGMASQTVTIQDTTPPVVTAPADITIVSTGSLTQISLGTASATDLADVPFPAANITNDAPAGGFSVGVHQVTWTATDSSGNVSPALAAAIQRVTVLAPAVACSTLKTPDFQNVVSNVLNPSTLIPGSTIQCQTCHQQGSGFNSPFNMTGDLDADFLHFKTIASRKTSGGLSYMLAKPTQNGVAHSGGNQIDPSSQQYQDLNNLVAALETCVADTVDTSGLEVGTHYMRLRKATLALAGRLPTAAEEAAVEAAADEAAFNVEFDRILDQIMGTNPAVPALAGEDAFYDRLMEIYNDLLLTARDAEDTDNPEDNFDLDNFSQANYFDGRNNTEQRNANYGIAQAPLELIANVARKNDPFTEILTANYVMVNPYSATIYGAGTSSFRFSSTNNVANHDPDDFIEVMLTGGNGSLPHSGVLTTNAFLARYPSTNTNRNRHRSRIVYDYFLGLDVNGLADRASLDLDNVLTSNPTYDHPQRGLGDPQCTICHNPVDPISGLFKNWSNDGQYMGDSQWFGPSDRGNNSSMLEPGYTPKILGSPQVDILPVGDSASAVRWLATRITQQSAFIDQTIKQVFRGYVGYELPEGTPDANTIKASFTAASGYNIKTLIKTIIKSPYFRAINLAPSRDPNDFADIGMGRLLIPEQFDRKLKAVLGYDWRGPSTNRGLLDRGTYLLFYGGIDSENVISRTTEATALMAGVQERIANQAGCEVVPADFNQPAANRTLFPYVEITDVPDNGPGTSNIRQNIQYLHKHILGEVLVLNDIEITRSYDLFVDVWNATSGNNIPGDCRGGLGSSDPISVDANRTVRSWMAVVTYMLSDYKFLFE